VSNEALQKLSEAGATIVRMEIPEVAFPPVMISPPKIERKARSRLVAGKFGSTW
jgi:hypothetical protein